MHLYITSSYGNNIIMDTKRATLVNPLSPGKLLHHIKAVSFKLISRHLGHPWEISPSACHKTVLMISQHCSRHWPGAVRRQTITWGNNDPNICCHRVLPGHNELTIAIRYMADKNKYSLIFLSYSLKWNEVISTVATPDPPMYHRLSQWQQEAPPGTTK